jgi:hypothetical protein
MNSSKTFAMTMLLALAWLIATFEARAQVVPSNAAAEFSVGANFSAIENCETTEICEATKAHDYQRLIELCTSFLGRNVDTFENERDFYVERAATYRLRAFARNRAGGSIKDSVDDEISAADLGNSDAAGHVAELLLKIRLGVLGISGVSAKLPELQHYVRLGAELGNRSSITMLGTLPLVLSDDEKLYWKLQTVLVGPLAIDGKSPSILERSLILKRMISRFGEANVIRSMNKFSLSGGLLEPQASGLPGRDIIATLFNDAELRLGYALDQVWRRELPQPKASTARDFLKRMFATYSDSDPVNRLLVLREGDSVGAGNEISLDIGNITSNLQPNDVLVVRCGLFTHITKIARIDLHENKVLFSDPLWEFWQPSHNSCVSSFELVRDSYNRFFPSVPLTDVSSMTEAVITIRSRLDDDTTSGLSK